MYFTIPPEKPYQASKSNSFFTIILMVAFFMICVPVGYTMSNLEPSPMCGPFRVYSAPADIITVQIDNASYWFSVIWRVVTSSAFVAALIILLILLVYYCSALKSAHKDMVTMMKEQLVLEGKDKQFLLARINELGGAPTEKKKAPPLYQKKPTVRNVDEKQPLRNGDVEMEKQELDIYGNEKSIIYSPVHSEAPPPADYNYPAENTGIGNQSNSSRQDRASKVSPQNVQVAPASPANPRQQQQSALDDW
ncbi:hypothetical protein DPMN_026473 [Dreissena polymorpha]|uniref:Uncharacterized protein n=1 Tax=Dreissena polymorpha TaxID=45954 RepID=A0A9D4LTA5_DREPO|nr:hypothetical protein DPMN_026473 [Dreissena polymorpha]